MFRDLNVTKRLVQKKKFKKNKLFKRCRWTPPDFPGKWVALLRKNLLFEKSRLLKERHIKVRCGSKKVNPTSLLRGVKSRGGFRKMLRMFWPNYIPRTCIFMIRSFKTLFAYRKTKSYLEYLCNNH